MPMAPSHHHIPLNKNENMNKNDYIIHSLLQRGSITRKTHVDIQGTGI